MKKIIVQLNIDESKIIRDLITLAIGQVRKEKESNLKAKFIEDTFLKLRSKIEREIKNSVIKELNE